jgi:hypothetical protein
VSTHDAIAPQNKLQLGLSHVVRPSHELDPVQQTSLTGAVAVMSDGQSPGPVHAMSHDAVAVHVFGL